MRFLAIFAAFIVASVQIKWDTITVNPSARGEFSDE